MSFTFFFIFALLLSICIILGKISFEKLLGAFLYGPTFYTTEKRIRQRELEYYHKTVDSNRFDLTIIHKIYSTDISIIKSQLDSINRLVESNFGSSIRSEIVGVLSEHDNDTIRRIFEVRQNIPNFRVILREITGISWLVSGIVYSYGDIIIDSQYLPDFISQLKEIGPQNKFIQFIQPAISLSSDFCDPGLLSSPVVMTKKAAELVFSQLHNLSVGSSYELLLLCKMLKVDTRIQVQKSGSDEIHTLDIITNYFMSKITQFLYSRKYWTIQNQL